MALPKLTVPMYDVVCPSGLKVSFRPFLVKEEKLLMTAMESNEPDTQVSAIKKVLEECVGTISNIDVDKLPLFDVEFLFLNLRARSIGEVVTLKYKCKQLVPNANAANALVECGSVSEYKVDLLTVKPTFAPGHQKQIQLTPEVGIIMRYPTFKSYGTISRKDMSSDDAFAFLVSSIESIYDQQTVIPTKDVPLEEVNAFVDDLTNTQVEKIDAFFSTMPKLETTIMFKCPKCAYEEELTVRGLDNFFG